MGAEKVEDKWKGKMKGREQMFLVAPFSHQLTDMPPQRARLPFLSQSIKGKGLMTMPIESP